MSKKFATIYRSPPARRSVRPGQKALPGLESAEDKRGQEGRKEKYKDKQRNISIRD